MSGALRGYRRRDGRLGARNHILVLPSVVCADQTATLIGAQAGAVAVVHQHGCAQVGDDVTHTERAFLGFATNPNVGAVVVVSLGCETIQGRRLANLIAERGQRVEFTGIQLMGGTANTVERGREAVSRLRESLALDALVEAPVGDLVLGIATDGHSPFAARLAELAEDAGARALIAVPGTGPVVTSGTLLEQAGEGAEQHVALAGAGAQVIVSLRGPGRPAQGFATGPVVAVAGDPDIYEALRDDFDLDGAATSAEEVWRRAVAAFNGELTVSEERGARDFVLQRIARTM